MTITRDNARKLVEAQVNALGIEISSDDKIVILDESTIEKDWGWVFFYTSRKWRDTRDLRYALAGNSPFIVERKSGRVIATGTAFPIEQYIANYERCGNPNG
jgi:hypothetical protein